MYGNVVTVFIFVGLCNFENGLCGLKHDPKSEFRWLLWKDKTSTIKNALNFDHTTLSEKGNDYSSLKYNKHIMYHSLRRKHTVHQTYKQETTLDFVIRVTKIIFLCYPRCSFLCCLQETIYS